MSQYGNKGSANPPWARADQTTMNQNSLGLSNQLPQSLINSNMSLPNAAATAAATAAAAAMLYPQQQMYQGQLAAGFQQQVYNNMGTVQYPTRALNSAAFQNAATPSVQNTTPRSTNDGSKERVITGTVTKLQDNFGFVDDDIFFQFSCVSNNASNLRVGSRVLVEATFNSSMPFKWNAKRIQVLPNQTQTQNTQQLNRSAYNAVPPPAENKSVNKNFNNRDNRFGNRNFQQQNKNNNNKGPMQQNTNKGMMQGNQNRRDNRGFSRMRDDKPRDRSASVESDRKRQRNDQKSRRRSISRDKRTRTRSRSPIRKKRKAWAPRYNVQIPKFTLNSFENDVTDLKRKFNALYIPSDFFLTKSSWQQTLPLDKPFNLDVPCKFHVFHRDVLPPKKPIPEPADVDYLYSAKVVLLASPGLEDLYKKCIVLGENQRSSVSPDDDITIPAKLISFLIGQRSKEPVAIGGPWSPSQDGEDPLTDPGVLIKTAIRSTKYQTGIDLSNCTQWLRFLEIHYTRAETVIKGKTIPARVETVVLFIPDVWSCLPTRPEWDQLNSTYSKLLQRHVSNASDPDEKNEDEEDAQSEDVVTKKDPTHYSELDPKNMKVSDMRDELEARGLSPKGLKLQLIARLLKVIKQEADAEDQKESEIVVSDDELDYDKLEEDEEKDKEEEKEKTEMEEKERLRLENLYKLPDTPHVLVHPNTEFKSGKFSCITTSLYSLLNYRSEDNKEHSFELFLFAEMFNAMLNRDYTYKIYKSLCIYADKVAKEEAKEREEREKKKEKSKEDKRSDDEEKKDEAKKDKCDDSKKDDKDKKDDKKLELMEEKKIGKLITADPHLLLSFVYFDNTMCGYIIDKDLEDMLSNFCLSLSRAQVKKLVQKVISKDSLHYRKITDKTQEEIDEEKQSGVDVKTLMHSNRDLLPKTDSPSGKSQPEKHSSGFVTYNGNVVDVGKLMTQLERNEASKLNTERLFNKLYADNSALQCVYDLSVKNVTELTNELNTYKNRLSCSTNDLDNMSAKAMRYMNALFQIQKTIDPIIKENIPDNESTTSKPPEAGAKKGKWDMKTDVDQVNATQAKVEVQKDETNDKKEDKVEEVKVKQELNEEKIEVDDKPKRVLEKVKKVDEKITEEKTKTNEESKAEEKSNKADEKETKIVEAKKEEEKEDVVEVKEEKMETEENGEEQEEEKKPGPKRRTALKEGTPKRTPVKRATGTPKRKRN